MASNRIMNRLRAVALILAVIAWCNFNATAIAVDANSIEEKIRTAKIFKDPRKISARFVAPEADVDISSVLSETENDKKINAVLVAKALISLDEKNILRTRLRFLSPNPNNYDEVTVTVGDVKAFGSGSLSTKQFLESLELQHINNASRTNLTSATGGATDNGVEQEIKRKQTLILSASLISVAERNRQFELRGFDTSSQVDPFKKAVIQMNSKDKLVAKGRGLTVQQLSKTDFRKRSYSSGQLVPDRGEANVGFWQDQVAYLTSKLRSNLRNDTPSLSGVGLSGRVRLAIMLRFLEKQGVAVTQYRNRLQALDSQCSAPNPDKETLLFKLEALQNELEQLSH